MFTASPNECRECGWEVPVYGLCGSSYFPDPPHLLCLWGSNLPQLFSLAATSHAAWEGGMGSTFDHTFSWGTEGSEGGGGTRKQMIERKISVENPRLKIPSWNRGSRICNSETIQERRSGCQPNSFLLKKLLRVSKRLPRLGRKPTELCSCRKTTKLRFPKTKFLIARF